MYPSFNARALGLKLGAEETLSLAANAGFEGVDLMVRDIVEAGEDIEEVRRRMDDLGLRGGAFPLPMEWRSDQATFDDGLRRLPRLAEAAARLGVTRTATWVMPESREPDPLGFHVRRLGGIARVLARCGIQFGLEVIGVASSRKGEGMPFIHRLGDVEPLRAEIERLSGGAVGVLVDSWHLFAAGESLETSRLWRGDQIAWVHVADVPTGGASDPASLRDEVRGLPGETGFIDSRRTLSCLASQGYDGPVTAEPLARCRSLAGLAPEDAARKTRDALRSVWPVSR